MMRGKILVLVVLLVGYVMISSDAKPGLHDYGDALSKSILFFEGQRSGKLPSTQRLTWRKDSALHDGADEGMDLTGGYYDRRRQREVQFPNGILNNCSVLEYESPDLPHALEAVRWSTDYFLKSTATPGVVYAQVGDPNGDHNCWQRPEDMDTPRTVYKVSEKAPGSEVAAEIAAALAAASLAFKAFGDRPYSKLLLQRASKVFEFADKYRGSYNESMGSGACPFYCDFSGYEDELLWAAAWLHRATKSPLYWNYVVQNIHNFKPHIEGGISEFGWDSKHAGINVLVSKYVVSQQSLEATTPFLSYADNFVCSVLPESPTNTVSFSPVDYILGDNPLNSSYMVGYGTKFPQRIHHRASSLPSILQQPQHIDCKGGTPYFLTDQPNQNLLIGAVVGGPDIHDAFADDRIDAAKSEPTTYVNAPLVGLLAYFKARSSH
ncbi:UNVERIFIED_CONTAM: Endoglucanase 8 [Sesamum radiatum]|uniref:Endoglucanase n=1 Tax=Sesamum radiatum TaxID=300843 RepID=A0AAW2TEW2_SESRA